MKNSNFKNLINYSKVFFAAGICSLGILLSCTQANATETDETTEEENIEGEVVAALELPAPTYDIPDNADFSYEDVLYKPIDHYDATREPMNGERISVNYKGEVVPAYYWAPGDMVVFQVSLADTDIPKFEELSQEDQDTWKSFLSDAYATPAEAYYAEMLPTYTFYFSFEENKIVPFVEFDYGKEGKVVMMPYDKEEQGFYLEELSPSFLKLGNFEFGTYQFLTINDDTCYHILSCMDQVGNVYLYQYDANGNSCARADLNMLIGLRYLAERTVALNEYIDKVQAYQDNIRKIIAGVIIFVIIVGFAFIYIVFGRKKKDTEDDDDDDDEDEFFESSEIDEEATPAPIENELDLDALEKEYGVAEDEAEDLVEESAEEDIEEKLPEINIDDIKIEEPAFDEIDIDKIQIEEPIFDDEEVETFSENQVDDLSVDGFVPEFEDGDPTEGGLFFAADTDEMKSLFKESEEEPKRGRLRAFLNGDDIEDDDEDDDYDDDEEFDDDEFFPEVKEKLEETVDPVVTEEEEKSVATEAPKKQESAFSDDEEFVIPEHKKKTLASVFDDDDDEDEDDEDEKPRRVKKEKKEKKVKKEKPEKEKKVKEKPEKKKRRVEEDDDFEDGDDGILDLEDL